MACSVLSRLGVQTVRHIGHLRMPVACKNSFPFSSSSSALHVLSDAHQSSSAAAGSSGDASTRPKAVIFDLGGVVVPSPLPVFAQFEKELNLNPGSVVDTIKKTGADGSFARLERGRGRGS
jgi:hypothetical protein